MVYDEYTIRLTDGIIFNGIPDGVFPYYRFVIKGHILIYLSKDLKTVYLKINYKLVDNYDLIFKTISEIFKETL